MLSNFFNKLGLDENEQKVFTELYKLWAQPASVIARYLQMERTTVYRVLVRLGKLNLVNITEKSKIKHFHIADIKVLKYYVQNQKEKYLELERQFVDVEKEFKNMQVQQKSYLPKIRIFDNIDGIQNLYQDIIENIQENKLMTIKFFASNVFEEQVKTNPGMKNIMMQFFEKIKKTNITMDAIFGNWIMIMEHISKNSNINLDSLSYLPAGNSAINIFVIGKSLYIVIFKDIPFGIKIDSEDLVYSMHFLLENLKVR